VGQRANVASLRKRPRASTSADVARHAGVSQTTVSLVLSGGADRVGLSITTRERVLAAAAALNYTPNHAAQSLRRRRTNSIAYVTRDLGNPYVAEVVAAVQSAAYARGYVVTVIVVPSEDRELQTLSHLRAGVCDGLLVSGGCTRTGAELRQLTARGMSCVLVQGAYDDPDIPSVCADLRKGAHLAVWPWSALMASRSAPSPTPR
jgi:DNA-binding LacI/PurR family transcriptional regulator